MSKFQAEYNIAHQSFEDFIPVIFVMIDDLYKKVAPDGVKYRPNIDKALLSDSEIITIALCGEIVGVDSENAWYSFVKKNKCVVFFRQEKLQKSFSANVRPQSMCNIPLHGENGSLSYLKNHRKKLDKISMYLNGNLCRCDYNLVNEPSHKFYKLNKMMNHVYWAEMWLTRTFYEKYIAVDATKLYETRWKFIADYLIPIDFYTIKLDWSKYENMRYRQNFVYGEDAFDYWLDIYRNFKIDWV